MSENTEVTQDELTTLKARADLLKISYHPSIGIEKLREKIAAAMSDEPPVAPVAAGAAPVAPVVTDPVVETEGQRLRRMKREAHALVRIRLTCMNPAKKDWDGEIITTGNSLVGTISKYVPFNAEEGWHVPHMIYEQLVHRMCQVFVTAKLKNGAQVRQGKQIRKFAIEVLPPLTPDELQDLAQRQAIAKSVD